MTTEWKPLLTMQEVAEAQAQGWEIQTDAGTKTFALWIGESWYERWQFRGRPRQPAMKKVKIHAYLVGSYIYLVREDKVDAVSQTNWIRFPSGDLEGEVPA